MRMRNTTCGYGKSVDNWSIGVIAYILLCGYPPFYDEDQATLFQTIMAGVFDFHVEYWSHISDSAKDLIRRLLTVDPAQRLTAEEALRHPWIAQEGGSASNIDIHESFTTQLAKFNARRKLRAAMKTVAMVTRLKRLGLNAAEATADEQEETSDSSPLGSPTTEFAQ
ncbi:calcium/calmodulin-dependent protein kinase I [Fonticula alba]|uniref:Calcium/calmodulin-dependent protein kinase I n=1 Tax=Fonticula alba TaxID=691883 RepID=A0A058ZEN5_FONAL|nr:calcium/calmodulin-dependent protein kinase I [Fonticula alba]KCV72870.1 calcium/calmodulin-dependent protein kinase I [Fonticula alba]|eukprot:XP_009492571.1 calcium/calmodulin-dependent protein kinase I [Fonticula alba]